MHDCRAVEVSIFPNVGELSAALWEQVRAWLLSPGRQPRSVFHGMLEPRAYPSPAPGSVVALDSCARFYLLLNHFDLGREKEIELFDSVVKTLI